jgi:hypothetical protein
MGERLDRGRRYANAGKVLSLELADGKAIAKIDIRRRGASFQTLTRIQPPYPSPPLRSSPPRNFVALRSSAIPQNGSWHFFGTVC